jgi:hypothetical protein
VVVARLLLKESRMKIKMILMGLLLGCLAASLSLPVHAQSGTGTPAPVEWKRYELGNGTISVLLPGKPTEEFKRSPPELEVPVDSYVYSAEVKDGVFVAQYSRLGEVAETWPEAAVEAFYNGQWGGVANGLNSLMEKDGSEIRVTVIEKRNIRFSGHNGREITYKLGTLKGRIKMSFIGRDAFTAMVLGTDALSLEEQEKFFNSFTIKATPKVGKPGAASSLNQ